MILSLLSGLLLSSVPAGPAAGGDLVAIRVKRAETVSGEPIEHALILVEGGKIVEIGEDLPVERGIRVIDRPEWVATPGLINARTRIGARRYSGRGFEPQVLPVAEIDPRDDVWGELLELGVTTVGFYPAGSGIPGQAIALRTQGDTLEEMLVREPAYLQVYLQANASSKKALRDAFKKVDEYQEKVAKEREKWEKEQEKKKKSSKSSSKKEDDKESKSEDKKEDTLAQEDDKGAKKEDSGEFVPPEPDEKVRPFLELRDKGLSAMMSIRKAADYLHLLDVIEREKDVEWFLEFPLSDDADLYEVAQKIGERGLLVVTEPEVTLQTNSLRERNIPAELARAGAHLALTTRFDSVQSHADWLPDVGRLVGQGLSRQAALAAVTLEPARALGLDEELGSLEKGKVANIVFWSGDPLEPSSRVRAVMLEGDFAVKEQTK